MDTYGYEQTKEIPVGVGLLKFAGSLACDSSIRVWDLQKKELVYTFGHNNQIISMMFTNDNEWLVTSGYTVRIWEMKTGKCLDKYNEHEYWTDAVALTSDKQFLAIADGSKCLRIWDTKAHKCVCFVSHLAIRVKKLYFSLNNEYLLGITEKKDELLFKFTKNQAKFSLNLVNRSGSLNLNCFEANLKGAYGISPENQQLLKQRGATGDPSIETVVAQQSDDVKKIIMFAQAHQSAVKTTTYSTAEPKIPVTYDNWVVSILRKPTGKNPDHAFLVIEGINQLGKGLLIKYELVDNNKKPGYCLIVSKYLHDISPKEMKMAFCRDLMKQEEVLCKAWSISRQKALLLIDDAERDKTQDMKYFVSGKNSIFVKSMSTEGHSCFTWAREKLYNLDDDRIKRDIPEKFSEFIAAKTSFYIGSDETSNCSLM